MDSFNQYPRRWLYTLLITLLATWILTGCEGKEPSKIESEAYSSETPIDPAEQASTIGKDLGLTAAKPGITADGQVLFAVQTQPLLYSDAGLLVALEGKVLLAESNQLSQSLWRQTAGPEAVLLNADQLQAQVVLPHTTTATHLEFALLAADTEGHVAESHTRIRLLPLTFPLPANASAAINQQGQVSITLSLPEPPSAPVTLHYSTQDGTAQAGRDYVAAQGQVVLDGDNPQARIDISVLNSATVSGDLYFRVHYTVASNSQSHYLYVVLPREATGTPSQPGEPIEPDPTFTTYNIIYTAGEGGRIQGETQQTLSPGQSGPSVTAVADPGYRFIRWSDGLTTATRTATNVNANLQVAAQFRRNELWLATGHQGNISVNAGPTTATIDWPTEPGKTYNLIVTADPETEIQNYSVYGATLHADVTPPIKISELSTDQPVYLALEEDGVLKAWSSFVPRVLGMFGSMNTTVHTIVVDEDGNRYIGGEFTSVRSYSGGGLAFNLDAKRASPPLAGPNIDGGIRAVLADGMGGWYIGGFFDSVNNQPRSNLAHINAAGELTDWNPGVNGSVWALAIDRGIIYVAGGFSEAGGEARASLAAFDRHGQLLPWNPGTNGGVYTLSVYQGIIYAGGAFTLAGGETRSYLAAFDVQGRLLPWNPTINASVNTLAIDQDVIYVGGLFSRAEEEARERLAAFDVQGKLLPWKPWISGSTTSKASEIYILAIDQGVIYTGGFFNWASGGGVDGDRSSLAAFDTQGKLLPWNPKAGSVYALSIDQGVIYAGGAGSFGVDNEPRSVAAFDKEGQLLAWNPGITRGAVYALSIDQGVLYVGGSDFMAGGEARSRLAAFDAQGQLLPWNPGANDVVYALTLDQGVIYAGGRFTQAGEEARSFLAAFDSQGQLLPWNPGANGVVYALTLDQGVIYAGGELLRAGGEARAYLAAFDRQGTLLPWNPRTNGRVRALSIDQGVIYAGGDFTQAGGATRSRLAAFDIQGQLLPWNPGASSGVYTLTIDQSVIYAGGEFTQAGGEMRDRLAAFDTQGLLLPWNPGASDLIRTLAIDQGVIYAGGAFTQAGGESRDYLAAFDLTGQLLPWNPAADISFISSLHFPVNALTVHHGVIYAGGSFFQIDGQKRSCLATLDLQGILLNQ